MRHAICFTREYVAIRYVADISAATADVATLTLVVYSALRYTLLFRILRPTFLPYTMFVITSRAILPDTARNTSDAPQRYAAALSFPEPVADAFQATELSPARAHAIVIFAARYKSYWY